MTTQHTPGTWYTSDKGPSGPHYQGQVAVEETGRTIAITYDDEGGHNARLIAAAPEMLDALKTAGQVLDSMLNGQGLEADNMDKALMAINHAIAKMDAQ